MIFCGTGELFLISIAFCKGACYNTLNQTRNEGFVMLSVPSAFMKTRITVSTHAVLNAFGYGRHLPAWKATGYARG